jgi:putative transposase
VSDLLALAGTPPALPLTRVSQLLSVSRSTLYRSQRVLPGRAADLVLRDRMQRLALQMPAYGYRRMTAALQREGVPVNHKRVLRLMRADNLLCLRRRPFVRTTDARHHWPLYPNLVPALALTGVNQLWVADITYVRLRWEFI